MKHLAVIGLMICALGLYAEEKKVPATILQLCDRGTDHYTSGSLDSAVLFFLQAELRALQLPEPLQQALSLEMIGQLYQQLDFRGQSLDVYEKALSIRETLGDTAKMTGLLDAIAGIHFEFQDFEQASAYWQKAKPFLVQRKRSTCVFSDNNLPDPMIR